MVGLQVPVVHMVSLQVRGVHMVSLQVPVVQSTVLPYTAQLAEQPIGSWTLSLEVSG
jgi:hypothetical protein